MQGSRKKGGKGQATALKNAVKLTLPQSQSLEDLNAVENFEIASREKVYYNP